MQLIQDEIDAQSATGLALDVQQTKSLLLEVFSGRCPSDEINQGSSSDGRAGGEALDLALDLVVVQIAFYRTKDLEAANERLEV